MSYHVNKKKRADGTVYWRLLRSEWSGGKATYKHIPMGDMLQHGLSPDMSIKDARIRVKQLNALTREDRAADRRKARALEQAQEARKLASAHLPDSFVQEFERHYLRAEMDIGPSGPQKYKKALSAWSCAKLLITAIDLPQHLWFQHKRRFYGEFAKRHISPSYMGKVMRALNQWGAFIAMKTSTSYIPIPAPRGYDAEMVKDAYKRSGKPKKESAPLTPEILEQAKARLKAEQWRWLYVAAWLGLRPSEVDNIKEAKVVTDQGVKALLVYQNKLAGKPDEDRVKIIHLVYPEQIACLDLIKQEMVRPIVPTLKKYLGGGVMLYGGRKNFVDLMLDKGQEFDTASQWLGHSDPAITRKHYKQKLKVKFKKAS